MSTLMKRLEALETVLRATETPLADPFVVMLAKYHAEPQRASVEGVALHRQPGEARADFEARACAEARRRHAEAKAAATAGATVLMPMVFLHEDA
ncbi:hypothetical protein [Sphaerotilus microaerophilus]|uniref:Uncharacterized protein n=1 Tax=Sphaerotilus microaerophilus TaxID=2914710 RepID=A0ABM7YRC6_9BURK|nr:hypothetical protein [Sphaerotilus sp. FB-5]BDI07139.1 hypothetical protein CATMQ487_41090 [Sphaerotilus sp. FB-5]